MTTPFPVSAELGQEVERLGLEFYADFYARALETRPDDRQVLEELAHALTRVGRHAEGLRIDRRLASTYPEDPTVLYNLACSLALCGHAEEALDALEAAFGNGFEDGVLLAEDADLRSLRAHPRFQRLLEQAAAASG